MSVQLNDFINFDLNPQKFVYFYSDRPFKTVEKRKKFISVDFDELTQNEYIAKYYKSTNDYIIFNNKRLHWIQEQLQNFELQDEEDLRKNLKILIIIGSRLKYKN